MPFRLQGTAFLITWSQLPLPEDLQDAANLLQRILPLLAVYGETSFVRAGIERHQDGGFHCHCYAVYASRIDRRLTTQWDLLDQHPNVRSKRTKPERRAALAYAAKDGVYADEGELDPPPARQGVSDVPDLASALTDHQTYQSWLQYCLSNSIPFGYASEFWKSSRAGPETLEEDARVEGQIHDPILLGLSFSMESDRALVLLGPSGVGKTTWARRNIPKPALFVRHVDDLRGFRVGYHVGLVFDDMCFKGDDRGKGAWPRTSQIHLLDFHVGSSIHCRYLTCYIPAGIHKIFCGNYFMFNDGDEAINRRITRIDL